jgi:shikimate kinase
LIYQERVPYYERYADITIHEDGKDVEQTITEIASALHHIKE